MPPEPSVKIAVVAVGLLALVASAALISQLPGIGAGALLFPARKVSLLPAPGNCVERIFDGNAGPLAGWVCHPTGGPGSTTIVYLHGTADNRDSAVGVIQRFTGNGYNVVAYDGRAHGRSGGDRCTYGFFEKDDLRSVIATLQPRDVVLMGHSLGAAIALQTAPIEPRVRAVVARSSGFPIKTCNSKLLTQLST